MYQRIRKRLEASGGFTVTELLAATVIMLLAMTLLTSTINLAVRQFYLSTQRSKAQLLCSTICTYLESELTYAKFVLDGEKLKEADGAAYFDSDVHNMGTGAYFMVVSPEGSITKVGSGAMRSSACGRIVETSTSYEEGGAAWYDIAGEGMYQTTGNRAYDLDAGMTMRRGSGIGADGIEVTVWVQGRNNRSEPLAKQVLRIIPMEME